MLAISRRKAQRSPRLALAIAAALALLQRTEALGRWLYLGTATSAPTTTRESCNALPGLSPQQKELCRLDPKSILSVRAGVKRGIRECQNQFAYERWNCTAFNDSTIFGNVLLKGTRETAFVYAITSAAVTHAVTQACSYNSLSTCSCDLLVLKAPKNDSSVAGSWDWGGCSDNINYGLWFSRVFVDAAEKQRAAAAAAAAGGGGAAHEDRSLLHLHNAEAGRKAVEKLMSTACRCHGTSGSCSVKTCWRALPKLEDVGRRLKAMYENSALVPVPSAHGGRSRAAAASAEQAAIDHGQLVYADASPTYCAPDPERGALGVAERRCHRNATGAGSCDVLCCGRGYNTQTVTETSRCRCTFHWCCSVVCSTCEVTKDVYTCK